MPVSGACRNLKPRSRRPVRDPVRGKDAHEVARALQLRQRARQRGGEFVVFRLDGHPQRPAGDRISGSVTESIS